MKINSDEVEKQLVSEYLDGVSVEVLRKKYGYKTRKSVTDKVKKHKGQDFDFTGFRKSRKSYALDFTVIDTPFTAYFLGLMATDGYVSNHCQFGLDLTDEDCVKFISEVTGKSYRSYPPATKGHKDRHRILFSDSDNVKQLARYSITQDKTYALRGFTFAEEEQKFFPYFLRGVIDGDGTIGYTSYGQLYFSICSASIPFLEWLKQELVNKMFMYELSNTRIDKKSGVGSFSSALERNINILRILSYDRPYGMMRKFNTIHEQASETVMETPLEGDGTVQPTTVKQA